MNIPRLLLAIVVAFIIIFGTDFLIHVMWLKPDYEATKAIWRPENEMKDYMLWMSLGQLLCAATLCVIWAMGFGGRCAGTGALFGLIMGMFQQVWVLIIYMILPMPANLAVKWYFSGLSQAILIGIAVALIYKPRATAA